MVQIQCLDSTKKDSANLFSRFVIGPFKEGQGLTIGNALRRVLLSDLPGLAIVGVRINEVNHEYANIPGVQEDIIDILLNIKQIVLKGEVEDFTILRLSFNGPGILTAKDITVPKNVTIVKPNQYIATVNTDKTIEIEFLLKNGKGYLLTKNSPQVTEGFLNIDAVFSPVKNVNFFIETVNKNIVNTLESIILEVETDGSVTPLETVNMASEMLQVIFSLIKSSDYPSQLTNIIESDLEVEPKKDLDSVLIEELELSVRSFNCLKRANINTLGDLLNYSKEELLEFKNFGQKSANEVCLNLEEKFNTTLN